MYESAADPYCYPGTTVLKNLADIRDQATLEAFEDDMASQRAEEPSPGGRLSVSHYKALHHHLFQDVYPWAGRFRTVRISKGGSMFCYPENIAGEMRRLFAELQRDGFLQGLTADAFAQRAAHFLAELNAIHPFREGNGRTQLAYLTLLAEKAGHPIDLERLNPEDILNATIVSFSGNESSLAAVIRRLHG
ncbi:adenosine monophosphate-protein transferase [Methylosinus sporium]|uniref:protein adenylyltransferase n=1 Tax=Methylosinus sporium TaxID=428 RepID=A0A549T6T4_METSR|nr:Fic family protein [Methylosinus sporium]TRL37587.1 adenosine monophosphate-protein transferase [Methylosinus sporium]